MKTQIFNSILSIHRFTLAALVLLMCSCGSETDSTTEETTTSDEVDTEIATDEPVQIVEDVDNAIFKKYFTEKEGVLIDVRTAEEFDGGHIEGALNRDYTSGEFEQYIDSLEKEKPVFVYCQAGGRSAKARDLLQEKKFREIYNLENGYGNWTE
ncbi:MAG: rhodanese-like domain-containing protein [Crocinitomicaceae bacterium]